MNDNDIIKAFDILDKFEFFGGQRAGRELWFNKPADIQEKDIGGFNRDIDFLKVFINRQIAEIERLEKINNDLNCQVNACNPTQTIKDFAVYLCDGRVSNDPVVIAVKCAVKEMTEEQE
jgi:hypothetical protein